MMMYLALNIEVCGHRRAMKCKCYKTRSAGGRRRERRGRGIIEK